MNADAIIKRMNAVLTKAAVTNRVVYKRVIYRHGGDELLGRPAKVANWQQKLDPQPLIMSARADEPVALNAGEVVQVGDLLMTTTPTALSKDDLTNKNLVIVLVHPITGAEEQYSIVSYRPVTVYGADVMYNVLVRSKSRPA